MEKYESVLTVPDAIRLLKGGPYDNEAKSLEEICSNIQAIEKYIPDMLSKMKDSFTFIVESFASAGVIIDGVYFKESDIDATLARLDEKVKEADQANINARNNYIKVSEDPTKSEIEKTPILKEKEVIWNNAKSAKDKAWENYLAFEKKVKEMKEEVSQKGYNSFEHLTETYSAKNEEMLAKLKDIKDDSTRIEMVSAIEKIGKYITQINEREAEKQKQFAKIDVIGEKLGIKLLNVGILDYAIVEEKDEIKVSKEVESEPVEETEPVLPDFVSVVNDLPVFEEPKEVVSEIKKEGPAVERHKVLKEPSAFIEPHAKALIEGIALCAMGLNTDNVDKIATMAPACKTLNTDIVGNSNKRIPELDSIGAELTKETAVSTMEGLRKCTKEYPNYKKEKLAAKQQMETREPEVQAPMPMEIPVSQFTSEQDELRRRLEESMKDFDDTIEGATLDQAFGESRGI